MVDCNRPVGVVHGGFDCLHVGGIGNYCVHNFK